MIKESEIKRHGNGYIKIAPGITAVEGFDGLKTLSIRKGGKEVAHYRGSSLYFSENLTAEDRRYLADLAEKAIR